ncbi:unnamed protein product [Closterium sp. NIES-53]
MVVGAAMEVVEVVEVVAVEGVVVGVGALAAAVVAAVGVAVVVALGVVVVGLELLSAEVQAVARGSSSSVGVRPRRPSSFVSGFLSVGRLGVVCTEFGDKAERPCWAELLRYGVAIFDLDYDAILAAMYALSVSAEGDCYMCVLPEPSIEAAALGPSESALPGTALVEALYTFTLHSGASRCFFRDNTTLTPLSAPVPVRLADPSRGPVLACSSTVLPCLAVPSSSLSGLHLPSFSMNLVSTAAIQDAMVTTTTPGGRRVPIYTCTRTGRHLATFTRRPGSSLYTLATEPPQVAASAQVSASGPVAPPCSCRPLSHLTLLWHHRLGHSSLPRLRGMHSRLLVSSLPSKGEVLDVLIPWIRAVRSQLCERFRQHLPVLRLHSDRGGEFSSDLLRDFCRGEGILQPFTLPASPQQNGIAERRIGLVMEVARTSMIHAAAPHFLWPFAVWYAAHQLSLWPRVSLPETSSTLRWTEEVGNASVFRVWGSRAFVRDTSADKLSAHPIPCVFLGFPPDAPGWQFYHPTSRCVFPSQDVTFDESVPFYRLFPYRSDPPPPPLLFLAPGPSPVDPLPPQDPAPSGAASGGAESRSAKLGGAESEGAGSGGAEPGGAEPWGVEPKGVEPGGAEFEGAESGGAETRGTTSSGGIAGASPRLGAAGAGDSTAGDTGAGGVGATHLGGTRVTAGAGGTGGAAAAGPRGAHTRGAGAGVTGAIGAGARGTGAGSVGAGGAGAVDPGVGGAGAGGAVSGGTGAGGTVRPRPLFVPLLRQVLNSFTERGEPESRPASPFRVICTGRPVPRLRPPRVCGTHAMALRPSSVPLRVPLPPLPESSLPAVPDPESDCARAASPTVSRLLATIVTDPSFESTAASALVAELVDFAAACCLDYATALVAECDSASPTSVGGECALGTDVLEDRHEDFECLACAVPHLVAMMLAPEGDPDAPDIPTPRSYAEAITGRYSSQWQIAMDAEMASLKSTGTYINAVPPSGANIVDGMWIFRVKRPPGSPPFFKARYVARGFTQRQGVDYFQTFSPNLKMTTLRVLLHVTAQRDYELHSLDFSTAFLQGSLHEEIWLRRPPGLTGSFPAGTQWSLRQPVYGLRQAPREWHDTLRTTLAALGFTLSIADPSLFLRTNTSLPPFYVLVYVDNLVFATAVTKALTLVKSELQKRHTCTDLGPSTLRLPVLLATAHSSVYRPLALSSTFGRVRRAKWLVPIACGLPHVFDDVHRLHLAYPLSLLARYVAPVHWAWGLCLEDRVELSSLDTQTLLGSSCGAEIYAGVMAAQELRWLTYLLTDLGEQSRSPPQRGQLRLAYVATRANTADIFTKALPPGDHQRFFTVLGLVPTLPHLLTA